jgi:hypothetical protein
MVARRGWNKWAAILVVAILVQSICMIALYERYYRAINHSMNDVANIRFRYHILRFSNT